MAIPLHLTNDNGLMQNYLVQGTLNALGMPNIPYTVADGQIMLNINGRSRAIPLPPAGATQQTFAEHAASIRHSLGIGPRPETPAPARGPLSQKEYERATADYVNRGMTPPGRDEMNATYASNGAGGPGGGSMGGGMGGVAGGGGMGGGFSPDVSKLLTDWQAKMDQANSANEGRYQQIMGGYDQRKADMAGAGTQARADILRRGTEAESAIRSNLTQRGLGNTTVVPTMQMGAQRETEGNIGRLDESLRQQGSGMAKEKLDFMERRTDEGPSYGQMLELLKTSGQGAGSRTGGDLGGGAFGGSASGGSGLSGSWNASAPMNGAGLSFGNQEGRLSYLPEQPYNRQGQSMRTDYLTNSRTGYAGRPTTPQAAPRPASAWGASYANLYGGR